MFESGEQRVTPTHATPQTRTCRQTSGANGSAPHEQCKTCLLSTTPHLTNAASSEVRVRCGKWREISSGFFFFSVTFTFWPQNPKHIFTVTGHAWLASQGVYWLTTVWGQQIHMQLITRQGASMALFKLHWAFWACLDPKYLRDNPKGQSMNFTVVLEIIYFLIPERFCFFFFCCFCFLFLFLFVWPTACNY